MKNDNEKLGLVEQLKLSLMETLGISTEAIPKFQVVNDSLLKAEKPEKEEIIEESDNKENDTDIIEIDENPKEKINGMEYSVLKNNQNAEFRRQIAERERQQKRLMVEKKAKIYFLAALHASNNDVVKAKKVLGLKKINMLSSTYTGTAINFLAIDKAIEQLDYMVEKKHGEIVSTMHKKRK